MILLGYILAISFNKYIPNKIYMKGMKIEVKDNNKIQNNLFNLHQNN